MQASILDVIFPQNTETNFESRVIEDLNEITNLRTRLFFGSAISSIGLAEVDWGQNKVELSLDLQEPTDVVRPFVVPPPQPIPPQSTAVYLPAGRKIDAYIPIIGNVF